MADDRRDVVFSANARADLIDIWRYLATEAGDRVADAALERLHAAAMSLDVRSQRGAPRDDIRMGLRMLIVRPYLLFYRVRDAVEIARVLHGRRDVLGVFRVGPADE